MTPPADPAAGNGRRPATAGLTAPIFPRSQRRDAQGGLADPVGEVELVRKGAGLGHDAEKRAHEIMRRGEYDIRIRVGRGKSEASYLGCDLSVDAVRAAAGAWL